MTSQSENSSEVLTQPIEADKLDKGFGIDDRMQRSTDLISSRALTVKILGSRLFLAPIAKGKVTGVDLSAIQPPWVPPNVKFEMDDVESPWVGDKLYDYVMCRFMTSSIKDWPKLVDNIHRHTTPGGWAEFQDLDLTYYSDDGSLTEQHKTWIWHKKFIEASELLGQEPSPVKRLKRLVEDAGFDKIHHKRYKVPVGLWPKDPYIKDLSMHNMVQLLEGMEGLSLRLFYGVLGWTEKELLALLAQVRNEIKTGVVHTIFDL
ncbi:Secondary metabolism regulator LAE1 [Colletotrichum sidae]|uniref:Secondary metabolism regulator LAE1 n=1 Tax=Colletotrichum sidae TaxID=1347389 RepID=A0A4R8T4V6_9PEZI|nr:Secondary metabolism regulator LAE1 [Colletotrichum sidae]